MPDKLIVSVSPHIHSHESTPKVMWSVFFALIPAGIVGVFIFGLAALKIIIISVLSCLVTEALIQKLTHRRISIGDGSAVLTGLLLAYNLSSNVPFWIPVIGGIFAIAVCKQAFGGLGANIFNPALAARAFLLASWPKHMTGFSKPFSPDAVTSATPLAMLKEGKVADLLQSGLSYMDLFLGKRSGCLGEVCILVLLIGAVYLLWRGYIWWYTPAGFILTLGGLSWIFGVGGFFKGDFLFSILAGGVILGAFFMATDYVTTPITKKGQLIFGIGCGVITFIIRRFGGYPEGISYSILMMNATVPLIDRYVRPRRYGVKK
ncbi:MAG: RnfABCDGE type electron transport complex subunit D [Candidatus Omnitrophica bacterium]|nr:RnfABCDGE type electron transport complex subunit D [Candidatus Omnitrophota bacterium]MCG2706693.1 RnfABCDGE type electron transport complex subunit D [Candidatus Omnitrophota bacterium]